MIREDDLVDVDVDYRLVEVPRGLIAAVSDADGPLFVLSTAIEHDDEVDYLVEHALRPAVELALEELGLEDAGEPWRMVRGGDYPPTHDA